MKLRIHVEDRSYDVEVDFLDSAAAKVCRSTVDIDLPAAVVRPRPPQKLAEDSVCRSPIAGRVSAVFAAEGRAFRRNEPLLLIEAMKMEIPICAAVDGTVKTVCVTAGEAVSARQLLLEFV